MDVPPSTDALWADFHPAVAGWFTERFGEPTAPQREGWPSIRARRHTLIAAPTGSGKTLAAFLAALDELTQDALRGRLESTTRVLYISPLKALSADVQKNLQEPLAGIRERLAAEGLPAPELRVLLRTGDTSASERAAMLKRPPHILVTTPESFFILLTSVRGREMLATVRTVIVDEIHALVGNKRGAHLALSLERLEHLVQSRGGGPLTRIGLSATQKPIGAVAHFLTGAPPEARTPPDAPLLALAQPAPAAVTEGGLATFDLPPTHCSVVDTGHIRERDLAIEVPDSPLEAVMSGEVWAEVYNRVADLVAEHRTTLVFVNTRRLAERVARHLSERLGEDAVAAHHGSMAREQRLAAEQRLKAGQLRVLVATASLELGIDVGSIDLVVQLGATKSIAAFLQRVGRSGHTLGGLPKGRLFPLTRDELVDCAALLDAVRRGELDRLLLQDKPLDILAQQIVAEAACEDWAGADLFALARRAWPFRELERAEFDAVVDLLAKGYKSNRGRHGAYLHHDAVNDRLRGRKGARHAAIVSGGAIPETAQYDVVLEPQDVRIGQVDEDFAVESLPGDIFQLGNTSWRILRVETGRVRVVDAQGQPPNIPFWFGEAPGRSDELSVSVSRLRETVAGLLGPPSEDGALPARPLPMGPPGPAEQGTLPGTAAGDAGAAIPPVTRWVREDDPAVRYLVDEIGVPLAGALQLAEYLAAGKAALGVMPSQHTLVAERFFDEGGGMQLVLHSPFGSRLNRAWGLALRKRFCRSFNFELQAAAIEDAIVLSLGPTHSFPLDTVFRFLHSNTARDVLVQALLDAPLFTVRWRHNANRALAVLRRVGARKVPAQLQRMRADDLLALVFPDQQACLENIVGDREVPDHPLVQQTLRDCLEEAMDIAGLERLLRAMEAGELELVSRDLPEPSPLAQEILNARPYAFLDDAPLEERRTQAVQSRRWLDPEMAANLAALDVEAIARVRDEAWPVVGTPDELHDALMQLGQLTEAEGQAGGMASAEAGDGAAQTGWALLRTQLEAEGRATVLEQGGHRCWVAAEWLPVHAALYPQATLTPAIAPPASLVAQHWEPAEALVELLRARLEAAGPVAAEELAATLAQPRAAVEAALATLEAEGLVLRGRFTPGLVAADGGAAPEEWCERGLLARIHRYTLNRLRREIEPVSPADFQRFLIVWQRLAAGSRAEGVDGLAAVLEQLEGFQAPAGAWEAELLAARTASYDREWLDRLCAMGRVAWARLLPARSGSAARGAEGTIRRGGPVASTPIVLVNRRNLRLWRLLGQAGVDEVRLSAQAAAVEAELQRHGASFFTELADGTGLLPTQLEAALGELVAQGRVTADSFAGLRALLRPARKRPPVSARGRAGMAGLSTEGAGRWALVRGGGAEAPREPSEGQALPDEAAREAVEAFAWVLLRRYGVVARRLLEREAIGVPWRDLLRVYRRLEARGEIRGGRFVNGLSGEQYALPEAVGTLREVRRQGGTGALVSISAADPLNLVGILSPGRRVASAAANRVLFRDGVPVAALEGGQVRFLVAVEPADEWLLRNALLGQARRGGAGAALFAPPAFRRPE